MSEQLLTSLAEHGVLGILLAVALYALAKQAKKLSEVEAKRTEDAQQVVEKLITLSEKVSGSIQEMKTEHAQHATRIQVAIEGCEKAIDRKGG